MVSYLLRVTGGSVSDYVTRTGMMEFLGIPGTTAIVSSLAECLATVYWRVIPDLSHSSRGYRSSHAR